MTSVPGVPFSISSGSTLVTPEPFLSAGFSAPFPTNSPWQNFVLNNATSPELVLPYLVQLNSSGIAFGYPSRQATSAYIIQAFVSDLFFTLLGGISSRPKIVNYDKLSVSIGWSGKLRVPLVWGSPYLTFDVTSGIPQFKTPHAILSFYSNGNRTKHKVALNNGQTWLIYSSEPLDLSSSNLTASASFTGIIRVANLPTNQSSAEAILDAHCHVYPRGGIFSLNHFQMEYRWITQSWTPGADLDNLLMLTLPVHRGILQRPLSSYCSSASDVSADVTSPSDLKYETLDGAAIAQLGARWSLRISGSGQAGWSSGRISGNEALTAVRAAVVQDVSTLAPIATSDTYFYGKALARAARLALIAEEVGLDEQATAAAKFLESNLTPWLNGSFASNGFVYDPVWGGVISKSGATDSRADFGNGVYNDHHFHFGYFIYASAVLTKLNSMWGHRHKSQIYGLVHDIFTLSSTDPNFPQLRNFDPYVLHSWASGLTEFADGRNQESTSEALNAYYAVSLVGLAFGDLQLASLGATVAAFEARASQTLWHIPLNSSVYEGTFAEANRVVGVLWANKRDAGLWFAPAEDRAIRLGIQVIPITPFTAKLFSNTVFAKQIVDWVLAAPGTTSDGWNGFVWSLQALYDKEGAIENVKALTGFDDGNSLSNMLWWVYSR